MTMTLLSPHLLRGGSADALTLMRAVLCPVVKLVDDFGPAAEFRAINPNVLVIGRVFEENDVMQEFRDGKTPELAAKEFMDRQTPIYLLNPHITIWEGPNEPIIDQEDPPPGEALTALGTPADIEAMRWYCRFETERLHLLANIGLRGVVCNFGVGHPKHITLWKEAPILAMAVDIYEGYFGDHEYQNVDDSGAWGWKFLRVGFVETMLASIGFPGLPRIITECGTESAWRPQASAGRYASHLAIYDSALSLLRTRTNEPPVNVLGACLFTSSIDWNGFGIDGSGLVAALVPLLVPNVVGEPLPVPPPPLSDGATHTVVNTDLLNVRAHPWTIITPPLLYQLKRGDRVRVWASFVAHNGQTWGYIAEAGNEFVNMRYLNLL